MDFTMLVIALALWTIVQSAFIWYPLQNYFSLYSVVLLLIMGWFPLPFPSKNEKNSRDGTKNAGDGELNSETRETQPQSAEKMRQSRQYLRKGHMKINYTQMTMRKMSEQIRLI